MITGAKGRATPVVDCKLYSLDKGSRVVQLLQKPRPCVLTRRITCSNGVAGATLDSRTVADTLLLTLALANI